MVVRWLLRALNDLATITAYIEHDNTDAARRFAKDIREQTKRLAAFPFLGRASERQDIRELVAHRNYLVSYRIRRDTIEILQVWHVAQQRRGESGVNVLPPKEIE